MDPVQASNDVAFRVRFTGHSGHLAVEPLYTVEGPGHVNSLPDFVFPPAFPEETPESVKAHIEEKYLFPRLDADEFSLEKAGRQWDFDWFQRVKVPLESSLPQYVIIPKWELPFRRKNSGTWIPESVQVDVSEITAGAQDTGSLLRTVSPAKDVLRASLTNRPFKPGGLEESKTFDRSLPDGATSGEWVQELLNGGSAQTIAPLIKDGLDLGELKAYPSSWVVYKDDRTSKSPNFSNSQDVSMQFDDLFKKAWSNSLLDNSEDSEGSDDVSSEVVVSETISSASSAESRNVNVSDLSTLENSTVDDILFLKSDSANVLNDSQQEKKVRNEDITKHFNDLFPDMALTFPFELDAFQKEAIYYLEMGESVFVAAHTSAGKTVVAEYAFALASKHCTRAIYTAPIKTISNQKYRDFCQKFDVGLLTGDVSISPDASCLIMTTEILRSMLYRGADLIRDVEWVIFDEVHYVNDVERGVVWEEVIIMLPKHVNIILLSATVPNTQEFADWIGRTKQKKIRVTGTTKRPVPLEHCLFYSGELYKVCEDENFTHQGLKAVKDAFKKKSLSTHGGTDLRSEASSRHEIKSRRPDNSSSSKQNKFNGSSQSNYAVSTYSGRGHNWGTGREASLWLQLINKLSKKSLLPVVVFCFSKNRCDKSAYSMSGTDLTSNSEKSQIRLFCDKAFSRLKGSDRNLPQIVRVQSLLRRGIGVHHAGLLPIVKEVVEMLFCRGIIKVLFSTETFAMGVNAPARTVVFDTLRKFDGKDFRQLLPGEYTQMAGRAGRRGLDKIGTVIVMCKDEIPEERDLRHVLVGSATRLESQFRLTYIMILHLLRIEELKVEDMLKRSFAEYRTQKKLPETQQLLMLKLANSAKPIDCIKGEPAIEEYYAMCLEAEGKGKQIIDAIMQSQAAQQCLLPGRVVLLKSETTQDQLLGVIVKPPSTSIKQYVALVLKSDSLSSPEAHISSKDSSEKKKGEFFGGQMLMPKAKRGHEEEYSTSVSSRKGTGAIHIQLPYHGSAAGANFEVRGFDNGEFLQICREKFTINQVRMLEDGSTRAFSDAVAKLLEIKSSGKNPPALDPVQDLKWKDVNLVSMYNEWTSLLQRMAMNKCHGCIKLKEHMGIAKDIKNHKDDIEKLRFQMSDEALQQMPDFQGRIDVLQELGCIDSDLVVQMKGRVACEMNSGEELICTECLFDNQLDDLDPEEAVAIMSAFVFQQRKTSEPSLTPKLAQAKNRLYETAIRLGELQSHFKLQIDPKEYASENLKFGLVEVVYEWAKGTPFADICELTDVPEGLIVRTIVRLDETCREFRKSAIIMGNSALLKKMEAASNAIKRDIVFAASLYITGVE